jgi:AdoMet-dependent heme synthase
MLPTFISPFCVVWEITDTCNLNCKHCRASRIKGNVRRNEIVEEIVLQELIKNRVLVVNISGGEPLLHPKCIEYVKYFSDNGIFVGLSTNGILFPKYGKELKDANIGFVQFSLDGSPEIHNTLRGRKDAFEKSIIAAKYAKDLGIKTQFNTVLTSTNLKCIDYLVNIGEKYGIELHFRRFVPVGFGKENQQLIPDKDEYKEAIVKLLRLQNEKELQILIEEPLISLWSKGENTPQIGCGAGITQLGIDTDGNTYPCIFYRTSVGNILESKLSDIWNNSELLNTLRSRNYGECKACKLKDSCGACNACTPNLLGNDIFCEPESASTFAIP